MAWQIEVSDRARRSLKRIDGKNAQRILDFLLNRVSVLENPRQLGSPLKGPEFENYWRYRVGDFRIIAEIVDETISIIVVEIGHRREVYR